MYLEVIIVGFALGIISGSVVLIGFFSLKKIRKRLYFKRKVKRLSKETYKYVSPLEQINDCKFFIKYLDSLLVSTLFFDWCEIHNRKSDDLEYLVNFLIDKLTDYIDELNDDADNEFKAKYFKYEHIKELFEEK